MGRHASIVLLDGACEYAMGLAVARLSLPSGATPKEDSFHHRFRVLTSGLGKRWRTEGWTGVSEMHAARNQAQHRGITVDSDELARWAADAERFVLSLVAAVFDVELHDVLLAEAIETESARVHLVAAETAVASEQADTAFAEAMDAFDDARARWRAQRSEAVGPLQLYGGVLVPPQQDAVNKALARIEDLAEVQPFAFDLGEYVWLQTRRAEVATGIAPSLDDARRAVLFVLFWILRWEAFAARYTERRWPEQPSTEPPETGEEHDRPVIWSVVGVETEATMEGRDQSFTVRLQLADVPKEHRDRWATLLFQVLADSAPKQADSMTTDYARVGEDGIVRLFQVPHYRDPAEMLERVRAAIDVAQRRYEEMLALERSWHGQHDELVEPYRAALRPLIFEGSPLVGEVSGAGRPEAFQVTAQLLIPEDPQLEDDFWYGFVNQGGGPSGDFDYHERSATFASSLSPDRVAEIARAAALYVEKIRAERKETASIIERQRQALEQGLRDLLA